MGRLRDAIWRLNPTIPEDAREDALRKVLRVGTPALTQTNRNFHALLRDGVPVEYNRADGSLAGDHARLIGFDNPQANDWLVVNQFTVIEGQHNRRPDIVTFVNGLPLGVLVRGVVEPRRFLDLLQHFIVFEEDTDSDRLHKIIAGYRQPE